MPETRTERIARLEATTDRTPNHPSHADVTRPVPGAPAFTITRRLTGYAYPANGNVHNPTPRYTWTLNLNGRAVDSALQRGPLVSAAREPGAVEAYAD